MRPALTGGALQLSTSLTANADTTCRCQAAAGCNSSLHCSVLKLSELCRTSSPRMSSPSCCLHLVTRLHRRKQPRLRQTPRSRQA